MTVAKAMAFAALILVSTACCPQKPTDPLAGYDKDKLIHCTGEPAYLGWCMNACATWEHLQTGQKSDWPFGPIVKSDRLNIIKPVYRPTIDAEPPPRSAPTAEGVRQAVHRPRCVHRAARQRSRLARELPHAHRQAHV
jgi:hypothetical protein